MNVWKNKRAWHASTFPLMKIKYMLFYTIITLPLVKITTWKTAADARSLNQLPCSVLPKGYLLLTNSFALRYTVDFTHCRRWRVSHPTWTAHHHPKVRLKVTRFRTTNTIPTNVFILEFLLGRRVLPFTSLQKRK